MTFEINGQQIYVGKSFTDNGVQYPTNWHTVFSQEQKDEFGIVWTADPEPERYDARFYFNSATPKNLDDVNVVDTDGEPVLDREGNQLVEVGLKNKWIAKQKESANSLLAPTDWYVIRKSESDVAIPDDVNTYRASVRTICGTREDQINACTTTDELAALFNNTQFVMTAEDELVENTEPFITPWPEQ